MIVCNVKQYPEFSEDSTEFSENLFHDYYYSLSAECADDSLIFTAIEHYREVMERFERLKYAVVALGGGDITLYRFWDKYSVDDEDYEPDIECVWEVYDDSDEEEMLAMRDE